MEDDLGAHYQLSNDIDATGTAQWNSGKGFDPVGPNESSPFVGTFDGNGYTISDLTINRPETTRVGLFGFVKGGEIRDLTLTDATVTGQQETGSVAGEITGSTITDITVSVTVDGGNAVGGVVGTAGDGSTSTTVTSISVEGTVNGTSAIGGVVGNNNFESVVSDVDSSSTVTGNNTIGGLVGTNSGTVKNATASGSVDGTETVGGLVGANNPPSGEIRNAIARGSVNGTNKIGGLVGTNGPTLVDGDAQLQNVSADGSVEGQIRVGGLVGVNTGTIQEGTASGPVTGDDTVGGLVGQNGVAGDQESLIKNTKATGDVTGEQNVGGLLGVNPRSGTVQTSFATGKIAGTPTAGGLVGTNTEAFFGEQPGTIRDSYWDIETTGQDSSAGNATGLTTAKMTGEQALSNMTALSDFFWQSRANDYPVLQVRSQGSSDDSSSTLNISLSQSTITAGMPTEVTVTVTEAQTQNPVEDATVEISDLQQSGTTNTTGSITFSINASLAGDYPISVSASGFSDATVTLRVDENNTTEQDPLVARFGGPDNEIGNLDVLEAVNAANNGEPIGGEPVTNLDILQLVNRVTG
ncbi:carboxypeptidase-like regulatory domain-containing protein (plasmid) [Haloplanus ruber]|nr:carboxypeptidase-like regulatory domain-containing protein [Haloplanus ruber]